jgi:hypothetical protein
MMPALFRLAVVALVVALLPMVSFAQEPPAPYIPVSSEDESDRPFGLQHLVGLNLSIFQPTVLRLQMPLYFARSHTWLAEAYAGSELFDFMAGGGVRVQFTAASSPGRGDALIIAPGLGMHFLPATEGGLLSYQSTRRGYVAADVDISWLHDFGKRFGYELGIKLGVAGRMFGTSDDHNDFSLFGSKGFPIINLFSGFRF